MSLFGPPTLAETLLPQRIACQKCRLCEDKSLRNPQIAPYGQYQKGILVIGEGPGEEEDRSGRPWQGPAGQLLQSELKRLGIDLFRDCLSYNAVNCRPITHGKRDTNREPTQKEIDLCRNLVLRLILERRPRAVLLLGGAAVDSVIGTRWKKDLGGIAKWRGFTIPDREFKTWLCPTYHPSYLLREESAALDSVFRRDLAGALARAEQPCPVPAQKEEDCVRIVERAEDVVDIIRGWPLVAWDTETTGLKPYDTSVHKICVISFSNGEVAYSIPYPDMHVFARVLRSDRCGKIAQHMKYDSTWAEVLHGYEVRNQVWDTMIAAHVLDNRPQITGLKFQSYIRFGIAGYDDHIEKFLKAADKKDGNAVNRVEEAMANPSTRKDMLIYGGVDSLLTYRVAMQQMRELGYEHLKS